jgi:hypothetical protein
MPHDTSEYVPVCTCVALADWMATSDLHEEVALWTVFVRMVDVSYLDSGL